MVWEPRGNVKSGTIIEGLSKVTLWGISHRVYVHSYLEFGGNYAEERYFQQNFYFVFLEFTFILGLPF